MGPDSNNKGRSLHCEGQSPGWDGPPGPAAPHLWFVLAARLRQKTSVRTTRNVGMGTYDLTG